LGSAIILALLVIGFAAFVTAHVALAGWMLVVGRPRWRGLVVLLVPPLAPLWGYQAGRRKTVFLWGGALALYTVGVILANVL
jgi:hypothetical protein